MLEYELHRQRSAELESAASAYRRERRRARLPRRRRAVPRVNEPKPAG
ncbi:hypothetical protein RM844_24355 [Streptomyces sp. DSM 44915]|uniref:Uncharacterized protein n=1 Tax=Streptomyces chisholmiae TaxID=3075540 RepID=A0ABU2JWM7_9ACTN|nr:hypothetical protein [Streptomyces sp. DSM 44915]MDT0269418.1 hypothetical protein [Streptomyces sp. DSM 44915]